MKSGIVAFLYAKITHSRYDSARIDNSTCIGSLDCREKLLYGRNLDSGILLYGNLAEMKCLVGYVAVIRNGTPLAIITSSW